MPNVNRSPDAEAGLEAAQGSYSPTPATRRGRIDRSASARREAGIDSPKRGGEP